jgi:hypothetical protein
MEDVENTPTNEVAPQEVETQSEQPATGEQVADAPAPAQADTAKEDYESRYKEVQSFATKTAQENAELRRILEEQQREAEQPTDVPELDPTVVPALDKFFEQKYQARRQAEKAQEFVARHREELVDPILDGQVRREIALQGNQVDYESALQKAKQNLDARFKTQIQEAQKAGIKEGQQVARNKELAGAVGDTQTRVVTDDSQLSADDFAKKHNIPRVNG